MAYEPKDNTGSVFQNDKKETDTHPDRTGSALIDGVPYWINGWLNKSKDGKQYLSLKFKRKEEKRSPPPDTTRTARKSSADMDDEIGF